jgi:putative phosphoribosyl transferase
MAWPGGVSGRAPFADRVDGGRRLARPLERYRKAPGGIVLGLPRGGVPVAKEVAEHLELPLDVYVVRKIGHPRQPELAIGAIASGGVMVAAPGIGQDLPAGVVDEIVARERAEIARRERAYRGERPPLDLVGRPVIVVDDGLATGATMLAAVQAIRAAGPETIVVAVPVGSTVACGALRKVADEVVCLETPPHFRSVGEWYARFDQTSDQEVQALLGAEPGSISPEGPERG